MSFLTSMRTVASNLLDKYGESISFTRDTGGTFDPATGAVSGASESSPVSGKAFPDPYSEGEIDGTIVQAGDVRVIVENLSSPPLVGDTANFDGADWRVMMVRPYRAQGGDVAYSVQLRK